jgi:hypothetical protein
MARDADRRIARLAAVCHGVFTSEHAHLADLNLEQRKHRIASGQWVHLHNGVYCIAGVPPSWKGDLLAACWAGGFRAVASHRSAAALWELTGGKRIIQEITCPRWRRSRHQGLIVHESKALDPVDMTLVEGIPVTTPERTLLDLGAVCGPRTVEMAYNRAEHKELVTPDSVRQMLRRLARSGRPGVRKLRRVVEGHTPGRRPTASDMETALLQILREWGFPEPVRQFVIRSRGRFVARVDLAFPAHRVAIEYDSDEWHGGRGVSERDASRRRKLQIVHWQTVTATRTDVKRGAPETRAALQAAFDRAHRFGVTLAE